MTRHSRATVIASLSAAALGAMILVTSPAFAIDSAVTAAPQRTATVDKRQVPTWKRLIAWRQHQRLIRTASVAPATSCGTWCGSRPFVLIVGIGF